MSQARGGDLRGLKALVAGLGILVVLGTALVIGIIIRRIYANPAPPSNIAAVAPAPDTGGGMPPASDPVKLPEGSKITGIAAAGGVFAVVVSGPAGDQVWIVNPQTGARFVTMSGAK